MQMSLVKRRAQLVRVGPNPVTGVPLRRPDEDRDTQGRSYVKTEAETGVMTQLTTEELQGLRATTGNEKRGMQQTEALSPQEGATLPTP